MSLRGKVEAARIKRLTDMAPPAAVVDSRLASPCRSPVVHRRSSSSERETSTKKRRPILQRHLAELRADAIGDSVGIAVEEPPFISRYPSCQHWQERVRTSMAYLYDKHPVNKFKEKVTMVVGCNGFSQDLFQVKSFDLPVEASVLCAELNPWGRELITRHHSDIVKTPIFESLADMCQSWKRRPPSRRYKVRIMIIGSPCQPFSVMRESSKKGLPAFQHPLFSVTFGDGSKGGSVLACIQDFLPDCGCVENVMGTLQKVDKEYDEAAWSQDWTWMQLLSDKIMRIRDPDDKFTHLYLTQITFLNASTHVEQERPRPTYVYVTHRTYSLNLAYSRVM